MHLFIPSATNMLNSEHIQQLALNITQLDRFHFFPQNYSLKQIPWNTYDSNLNEFPCSYSRKRKISFTGCRCCLRAHPATGTEYSTVQYSSTQHMQNSLISHKWYLETHRLEYTRLESTRETMYRLTKLTIVFTMCHSGSWFRTDRWLFDRLCPSVEWYAGF